MQLELKFINVLSFSIGKMYMEQLRAGHICICSLSRAPPGAPNGPERDPGQAAEEEPRPGQAAVPGRAEWDLEAFFNKRNILCLFQGFYEVAAFRPQSQRAWKRAERRVGRSLLPIWATAAPEVGRAPFHGESSGCRATSTKLWNQSSSHPELKTFLRMEILPYSAIMSP